jgi:hypothetical protein
MATGLVVTISAEWYKNVLSCIEKGGVDIDYWTNGWLPDEKVNNVERLEVYYENQMVLGGEILYMEKDTPINIFNKFKRNLESIGVGNRNKYEDFERILNEAFSSELNEKIGNIVFRVDTISSEIADGLKKRGVNIPNSIRKEKKELDCDTKINRIRYSF